MIEFNPNKKTKQTQFNANPTGLEKVAKPAAEESVEKLIFETVDYLKHKVTDSGAFEVFEKLIPNPNKAQGIDQFGIRISPADTSIKSKNRIMEKIVVYKDGRKTSQLFEEGEGTKKALLKMLDKKLVVEDELKTFVNEMDSALY